MPTQNHPSSLHIRSKAKPKPALMRLPTAQLRRLPRPHRGYEAFVELFATLVAQHGDELGSVGVDVDAMRSAIADIAALKSVRDAAVAQLAAAQDALARVDDTEAVLESTAWKQMLLIYGKSRVAARTNGQIEVALEPFVRFMKRGPRAKKTAVQP